MSRGAVEVQTIDGTIHRQWADDWNVREGLINIINGEKYTLFAPGQWVYIKDVDPL